MSTDYFRITANGICHLGVSSRRTIPTFKVTIKQTKLWIWHAEAYSFINNNNNNNTCHSTPAIKAQRWRRGTDLPILNTTARWNAWSWQRPGLSTPRDGVAVPHYTGGWVGPGITWTAVEWTKISCLYPGLSPEPSSLWQIAIQNALFRATTTTTTTTTTTITYL